MNSSPQVAIGHLLRTHRQVNNALMMVDMRRRRHEHAQVYYWYGLRTESGRVLLVDAANGQEIAMAVPPYPHGVITETLPGTDIRLGRDWPLHDPADYFEVLKRGIPAILKESGVDPDHVIGLGLDATSCSMLPTTANGTPLCFLPMWRNHPHAWLKLWKHHAAQPEANRLNQIAHELGYTFLERYGGKVSSEWFFPKAWQILNKPPEIYNPPDRLLEVGDWLVWQLTGEEKRSESLAGYKALWSKREGFPPDSFFKALDPRLEHIIDEKMTRALYPLGRKAGGLTEEAASWTGLKPGTAVAIANIDAHVSVPAATARSSLGPLRLIRQPSCRVGRGHASS